MYKTILVPLDGSSRAETILPHVENLAQRSKSKVIFIQVMEDVPIDFGGEYTFRTKEDYDIIKKLAEDYLIDVSDKFSQKDINVKTLVTQGPVVETIICAAKRENVDLIAIASYGRNGLSSVFCGSVAAGILHRADRPLLLIRSN
jgi:nucleotide-binding universal stress UspA family protein